jgi:hypothetical protein
MVRSGTEECVSLDTCYNTCYRSFGCIIVTVTCMVSSRIAAPASVYVRCTGIGTRHHPLAFQLLPHNVHVHAPVGCGANGVDARQALG